MCKWIFIQTKFLSLLYLAISLQWNHCILFCSLLWFCIYCYQSYLVLDSICPQWRSSKYDWNVSTEIFKVNIDTCFLSYSGNPFILFFLHDQSLVCLLTYMQEMSYVIHFCVLHQMLWTSFEINNHVSFKVTKPLERFIKLFAVVWKHFIIHQPSCPLRKINVTKVHLLDAIFLLIFTFFIF